MSETYTDHFDFYTRGPYAPFVHETRSAGTDPIRMIHATQPEGDFSDPPNPDLVLIEMLESKRPFSRDLGAGLVRHRVRRGDFELQPPNTSTTILAEGGHEIRVVSLPFGRVRSVLDDIHPNCDDDLRRLCSAPFRDLFLEQLCQRLWVESKSGNPHGDLFADAALVTFALTLSSLAEVRRLPDEEPRFSLRLEALITEFIDAHLDGNPGLGELIELADMPEASFLKAFKATTGQTPHQYVLSRRIARAQELLAAGGMSLAEIAYDCGFASQSHMTDVFRQKLGVTPGRYRKEVRG